MRRVNGCEKVSYYRRVGSGGGPRRGPAEGEEGGRLGGSTGYVVLFRIVKGSLWCSTRGSS